MKKLLVAAASAVLATVAASGAVTAKGADRVPTPVVYDGAPDWSVVGACVVGPVDSSARCFGTEAEMDRWVAAALPTRALAADCSSSLRLYTAGSYTGNVLLILARSVWLNLSAYSFSNVTSSFKVGACSSYLADYNNGGGAWYPIERSAAWEVDPTMYAGWNDRISSVYLR